MSSTTSSIESSRRGWFCKNEQDAKIIMKGRYFMLMSLIAISCLLAGPIGPDNIIYTPEGANGSCEIFCAKKCRYNLIEHLVYYFANLKDIYAVLEKFTPHLLSIYAVEIQELEKLGLQLTDQEEEYLIDRLREIEKEGYEAKKDFEPVFRFPLTKEIWEKRN